MSKSLAESAAEIMKASMSSAGRQPGATLGSGQDLGGQTPQTAATDIGVGTGSKAAAGTPRAATPSVAGKQEASAMKNSAQDIGGATPVDDYSTEGQGGQPGDDGSVGKNSVDGMKSAPGADQDGNTDNIEIDANTKKIKEEAELTEEEIDAYLDSLTEEELAELAEQALEEEEEQLDEVSVALAKRYIDKAADDMGSLRTKSAQQSKQSYTASNVTDRKIGKRSQGINRATKNYLSPDIKVEDVELEEQGLTGLTPELNKTKAPYPKKPEGVGSAPVVPGAKMPGKTVKEMVDENMGSCMEDVDALFNGESLSEDFRGKATTIFEAAVRSRVNTIVEQIVAKNEETISEEVDGIRQNLAEQVDIYLNYVVEEWMKENTLAVDTGLRSEIAEDFITGLKGLFEQHYIEIPEEKIQVAEELADQVVTLEQQLEESAAATAEIQKALNESLKNESIRKICEGLTEVQIGKMKSLAEGVEFTTEGEYSDKLAVIRENYFPSKTVSVKKSTEAVVSEDNGEVADVSPVMDYYVKAITKSLPK